ncbi:MAG: response regulator transcription factor [Chloroflexota bacterium]
MIRVFIIADEEERVRHLSSRLVESAFSCTVASGPEKAAEKLDGESPDFVLLTMDGNSSSPEMRRLVRSLKGERNLPVIGLLSEEAINDIDAALDIDDFVASPWDPREVAVRVKRVLWKTSNLDDGQRISCGDLVIDIARCEVSVKGRLVPLTFKEYELLRFLASHRGKVFTRQALLDRIWGHDYFGGDRTVDVHIRRLRAKIEDKDESFIETVRNMGYKFRENA